MNELEQMIEEMELMLDKIEVVEASTSILDMICLMSLDENVAEYKPWRKSNKPLS